MINPYIFQVIVFVAAIVLLFLAYAVRKQSVNLSLVCLVLGSIILLYQTRTYYATRLAPKPTIEVSESTFDYDLPITERIALSDRFVESDIPPPPISPVDFEH